MGRSRRKHKRSRTKVRVALRRKNPRAFKLAVAIPEALAAAAAAAATSTRDKDGKWDPEGSVVRNYLTFRVVSNPNLLGMHARRMPRLVQSSPLQAPDVDEACAPMDEFAPIGPGSDLESDGGNFDWICGR